MHRYVESHYKGAVEYRAIKSQGSGERLDRAELSEIEDLVASKRFDLVVVEDLGRIARRVSYLFPFIEDCDEAGTRVIAINDGLDTARQDWQLPAAFNAVRHEAYNKDTAQRIRRAFRSRFPNGDLICAMPFGFIKPPGAKKDKELRKDPDAEPIVAEIFRRTEAGDSFASIAHWLNGQKIPTGPSTRSKVWSAGLVGRFVRNPLLKGLRLWNRRKTVRQHRSGRHRSVKADPTELLERACPHLSFIDADRFDRLQRMLQDRNGKFSRVKNGFDPRRDVPKKRTYWPGGHAVCGRCGRPLFWGGHGRMDRMLCSGIRSRRCWNSCTFGGAFGVNAVLRAVLKEASELPDFDDELTARLRRELDDQLNGRRRQRLELDREVQALERKIANIGNAIAEGASFETFRAQLQTLEAELHRVKDERTLLALQPESTPPLPDRDELRRLAEAALRDPPLEDPEFQRMMRSLLPQIHLVPFRLCNAAKVVPRARIEIDFLALSSAHQSLWGGVASYRKVILVDLFDPNQHVKYRERIMQLRAEGMNEAEAAAAVGITVTAAQRAAALQRRMDELGITDPWIEVLKAPDDVGKMKSHFSEGYVFEPLPGFEPLP